MAWTTALRSQTVAEKSLYNRMARIHLGNIINRHYLLYFMMDICWDTYGPGFTAHGHVDEVHDQCYMEYFVRIVGKRTDE